MGKLADCQPVLLQKDTDERKYITSEYRIVKRSWIRHQNNGEGAKEHEGVCVCMYVCDRIIQYVVSAYISQNLNFFFLV